jgi:hypothetical protein
MKKGSRFSVAPQILTNPNACAPPGFVSKSVEEKQGRLLLTLWILEHTVQCNFHREPPENDNSERDYANAGPTTLRPGMYSLISPKSIQLPPFLNC